LWFCDALFTFMKGLVIEILTITLSLDLLIPNRNRNPTFSQNVHLTTYGQIKVQK
jgi:hypothetical protein